MTANGVPALYTTFAQSFADATGFPLLSVIMIQVLGYSTPLLPYQASPIVVAMGLGKVPARAGMQLCLALAAVSYLVYCRWTTPGISCWGNCNGKRKPGLRCARPGSHVLSVNPVACRHREKRITLFRCFCCFNDHRESVSFQEAPPTSAPSMSGWVNSSAALPALTEPPYWMITCSAILASALAMWSRMNLCTACA